MKHQLSNNSCLPIELHDYVKRMDSTHQDVLVHGVQIQDKTIPNTESGNVMECISLYTIHAKTLLCGHSAIALGEALIAIGKAHNARMKCDRNGGDQQ